jgi:hypothetical protein
MATRQFVSDFESWNVFIGAITPKQFIEGYEAFQNPLDKALEDFIKDFPFNEPIPEWLEDSLRRYGERKI